MQNLQKEPVQIMLLLVEKISFRLVMEMIVVSDEMQYHGFLMQDNREYQQVKNPQSDLLQYLGLEDELEVHMDM
jgi:hypothetical protein